MAAIANITLNDGLAVAKTFTPKALEIGKSVRYNGPQVDGIPSLTPFVQCYLNEDANKRKVNIRIEIPVKDAVSGIIHTEICKVEILSAFANTSATRNDSLAFLRNFLANAVVTDLVSAGVTPN